MLTLIAIAATLSAPPRPAADASSVRVTTAADLRRELAAARPGRTILVAAGTYGGVSASGVAGAEGRPVRIRGEDPASPPVLEGGLHLSDIAHVELEHLVLRGGSANGLNIDDGGTFETPTHHVTLRHLAVADCGDGGNVDGIKLSGVEDFRVESCTIDRWGRGGSAIDMVGCRRGVIEKCTIRDSETRPAASGVQAKGGSRDIAIRRCRFLHAGQRAVNIGGSTGLAYFRPAPAGFEARDITVEGCVFVGSMAPIACVGVDGAAVRRNTFHRPAKWFVRILQETTAPEFVPCRNVVFSDNLVAYRRGEMATPINVGPGTAPETFTFERTYWYAIDDPTRSIPTLPHGQRDAAGGADPQFLNVEEHDLRTGPASPARAYGAFSDDAR